MPSYSELLLQVKKQNPGLATFVDLVEEGVPEPLGRLLFETEGAAQLTELLKQTFAPARIAEPSPSQRAWELCGLWYRNTNRFHEALGVFGALYEHMIDFQEAPNGRTHKGMPLVIMGECHRYLGRPVLAKRYLMLAGCEDWIRDRGSISPAEGPEAGGFYFRAVWQSGLADQKVRQYAGEVWDLYNRFPMECKFPEWILQKLDQEWMTEFPSPEEASLYYVNRQYVSSLLNALQRSSGEALEFLAHYMVSAIPGCRAMRRRASESTDYDVVGTLEGFDLDFRSELGRYFVCECKDWDSPANFTTIAKFSRVLDSAKCRFGILLSRLGISGVERTTGADREQLKIFQDRGLAIVVVSLTDLERIQAGENFVAMLRSKYEEVRLDLKRQRITERNRRGRRPKTDDPIVV